MTKNKIVILIMKCLLIIKSKQIMKNQKILKQGMSIVQMNRRIRKMSLWLIKIQNLKKLKKIVGKVKLKYW
jgi:hypothetical protein